MSVKKKKKTISGQCDFLVVFLVTALVIFGVAMVFSASYYYSISEDGTPYSYLIKQGIYAILGFGLMAFCAHVDYHVWARYCNLILAGSILLLVMLLIPGFPLAVTVKNATRWISIGPVTLMPGELAKIAAIIFTSAYLARDPDIIFNFRKGIAVPLIIGGIMALLIMKQPNLSTAITVMAIIVGIMFLAGLKWRYILLAGGAGFAGICSLAFFADALGNPHWRERLTSFRDPFADALGDGYQVCQSLLAIGTGGLFGKGLGKSIQKNLYLPESQNDFILPIIAEELGFIFVLFLFAVYIVLIWRCFHISLNAPDAFGLLLAGGITIMIGVQVVINVAVVTSSMPPTGITLPFISYGGNALWLFMGATGILLNISKHIRKKEK